jgi:hypothetical protein
LHTTAVRSVLEKLDEIIGENPTKPSPPVFETCGQDLLLSRIRAVFGLV